MTSETQPLDNSILEGDSESDPTNVVVPLDQAQDRVRGKWGPVFDLPNVAIHTHVLPNGHVLMWGRRDKTTDSLDEHQCTPFLWNPKTQSSTNTPQPTSRNGTKINLFCAGHAFLPDGRLLVAGGHLFDGVGLAETTLYDFKTNTWMASDTMNAGRWYPTVTTLPDGRALVLSGSIRGNDNNDFLQVWSNDTWSFVDNGQGEPLDFRGLPLYPRMHIVSSGQLFMSGSLAQSFWLKIAGTGQWIPASARAENQRDYCPAVMYDVDKVLYIGGGNDRDTRRPTREVEFIDLGLATPAWQRVAPMAFRRRQHNATVLPDGTVLVTGGTQGGGGISDGFDDLSPNQPVHTPELWDPATGVWTRMADEAVNRCYHSTAVLLPDATVLSAGGGEYKPDNVRPNDAQDSHRNGQIFSPPYLFKGARPVITSAPDQVNYGDFFEVECGQPEQIGKVSWVSLPSVTHAYDENQRFQFLQFSVVNGKLSVKAPASANFCSPGYYMLFLISSEGVPSEAKFVQILPEVVAGGAPVGLRANISTTRTQPIPVSGLLPLDSINLTRGAHLQAMARQSESEGAFQDPAVVVGISGTCPYGIGACWGGAYEALTRLENVGLVASSPNADDSTARVFLHDERLPPLKNWTQQFRDIVNGTYYLRGVEVTLRGDVFQHEGRLFMSGYGRRPEVELVPLRASDKVQWELATRRPKAPTETEVTAYDTLAAQDNWQNISISGPLQQTDTEYQIQVRAVD